MKKFILLLLSATLGLHSFAQEGPGSPKKTPAKKKVVKSSRCPLFYITTGTGLNNNTGVFGASIDLPLDRSASLEGGAGISTWGNKLELCAKYYLGGCQRGWAFGLGWTYNAGLPAYKGNMETVGGTTEQVTLVLFEQTNVFAAAYKYWTLGKKRNRFYLQLGWSLPLSHGDKFEQTDGATLSDNSRTTMNLLAPGGPIAACGFSFGIR